MMMLIMMLLMLIMMLLLSCKYDPTAINIITEFYYCLDYRCDYFEWANSNPV